MHDSFERVALNEKKTQLNQGEWVRENEGEEKSTIKVNVSNINRDTQRENVCLWNCIV